MLGNMVKSDSQSKPAKGRRPTDVNGLAHFLGAQSTRDQPEPKNGDAPTSLEISRVMAALGRKGGKIGGKSRAKSLTAAQRSEIALKAARTRWDKPAER